MPLLAVVVLTLLMNPSSQQRLLFEQDNRPWDERVERKSTDRDAPRSHHWVWRGAL